MLDNIEKMDVKQLRNAVQLLYDEVAIMKRKYEDILYNLDDDNFSSQFIKEKGDMKTAIEVNAEGIKTKVSNEELQKYTTLEQTANAISTHAYASADLSSAKEITDLKQATDITKTYYIKDSDGNKTYYYYNEISKDWEEIIGGGIDTVFEQTATGFKLKGNVLIDGDTVVTENLKLSGNVTWDMSNSPVLTRYSSDKSNWHSPMVDGDLYMQMSFDGGTHWSTTTKVVGTDGKNGYNGSDANVTPQNVFNALTDNGANQGIFAAFVNNNNQIYINAEYLATKIANVADVLYLGDADSNWEKKSIYFNNQANITTSNFSGLGQDGLLISANGFAIDCRPDYIRFVAPNGSSFTNDAITLAEYVAQYGSGGGPVFAVFY